MYAKHLDLGELIQEQLWKLKTVHFFYSIRCMFVGPLGSQHQDPDIIFSVIPGTHYPTVLILEMLLSKY